MTIFAESIIAGVIASFLTVAIIKIINITQEFLFYRKFGGQYSVFLINGERIEGEVVELSYHWGHKINASSKSNNIVNWNSSIVMDPANPLHGEGVYSYQGKNDFGIHSILISPIQSQISVYFRNLSHRDGRYGGVIWQKETVLPKINILKKQKK